MGVQDDDGLHILGAQKQSLGIGIKRNHYLVMFTIDGSGSMSGSKWNQVCRAINTFIENLSDEDMISTIIFNDKA
jgi:hypothetical protein